jgi:GDP-mannose 6-dehydrogenase
MGDLLRKGPGRYLEALFIAQRMEKLTRWTEPRTEMKVATFGLGYVGTVTAACLAANGHDVWGVDVDGQKVDLITRGASPVVEPDLDTFIAGAVANRSLHATTHPSDALQGADMSLVCVGTPSSPQGSTDLTSVRRAVDDIGEALRWVAPPASGFHSVVIRSTVPPGTIDHVVTPCLEEHLHRSAGEGFGTAMCPEFLREGSGVADFFTPPLTVVGTPDARVADAVSNLLCFGDQPVHVVAPRIAEALKFTCNAFHATKVSFANEMGRLLRHLDVDTRIVMELFCEDRELNISPSYLRPGFAFGGSCLPKDLRSLLYLGRMNSVDLPLLAGALASNELIVNEVVDRVLAGVGRKAALLGLSFKMRTDDLRESPNVRLAETLIGKGFDVRIYDSIVNPARLVGANRRYVEAKLPHLRRLLFESPAEALDGVDVAIVSCATADVVLALLSASPPRIIDLSGRLGNEVEVIPGYEGSGW